IPEDQFSKNETLSVVFKKPQTPPDLSDYFKNILSLIATKNEAIDKSQDINIRNEFIYRVVLSINRLEAIVKSAEVNFTPATYINILDRMLRMQSVPFSGEPLTGIQIMGILETRTLDFKNLIILSVNEGILPAISAGSSFIPFSLREAFGLPSVNHQESIYAYHFYRLLQRAENVTLIYNSNSEGLRSGEMSRFITQMKYDELLRPDFLDLSFSITTAVHHNECLQREEEHSKQLESLFLSLDKRRSLSPSALNTWLSCRMKFFFRYINRLKEPDSISADIDPAMLGNILHEIMKNIYQPYTGSDISKEMLTTIVKKDEFLSAIIRGAVNDVYKAGRPDSLSGNELIISDVLMTYLKKILYSDIAIAPFSITNLEYSFVFELALKLDGVQTKILTGGKVDRIDKVSGITRIVDYKTGTVSESVSSIGDLFAEDRKKDDDGWLQTLLYCEAYLSSNPGSIVRPSVYKIRKLNGTVPADKLRIKTKGSIEIVVDNYSTIREEFLDGLKALIQIIFSENEPFVKTKDIRGKCSWCPYRILCGR
ncbi:MAG TPA: PD-(D/E)XK nuclease family protein, partial [Bacteroidales bacterium]|nr:PD-(D/E)XK nuclease family protein [Bacteroidales bacterium]